MKIKLILLILIISLIISCHLKKKDAASSEHKELKSISWMLYDTNNSGLPDCFILRVCIDRHGNKWLGMFEHGLVRFGADGSWHVYDTSNSGLPNDQIRSLAVDYNDNLWIGTLGGLAKFDGDQWIVYTPANAPLPIDYISTIAVDKTNTLWFGCGHNSAGGLMSYNGSEWTLYTPGNSLLPHSIIKKVLVDANDVTWVAPGPRAWIVKIQDGNWTVYSGSDVNVFPAFDFNDLAYDSKGNLWACADESASSLGGLQGTLLTFDGKTWQENKPSKSGKLANRVQAITVDHYDNLWVSVGAGSDGYVSFQYALAMFNGEEWFVVPEIDPLFPRGFMPDIAVDENNTIWVAAPGEGTGGLIELHPVLE